MVRRSAIPVFVSVLALTVTVAGQWVQTSGPPGGRVISSAIAGDTLFAGLYKGGLYRSTDKGEHWVKADSGFETGDVDALLMHNGTLFAETWTPRDNGAIRYSSDYGRSWSKSNSVVEFPRVQSFAATEGKIYAATSGDGILLSTDNRYHRYRRSADWYVSFRNT